MKTFFILFVTLGLSCYAQKAPQMTIDTTQGTNGLKIVITMNKVGAEALNAKLVDWRAYFIFGITRNFTQVIENLQKDAWAKITVKAAAKGLDLDSLANAIP